MGKKKGKAQNGRAKQKQKAHKGGGGGGGDGSGGTPRSHPFQPQMRVDDEWGFRGFAQNSPSTFTPRPAMALPFRHQAISFVSAGSNTPTMNPPRPPPYQEVIDRLSLDNQGDLEISAADDSGGDDSEDDDELGDEDMDNNGDDDQIQTNILIEKDVQISQEGIARMNIESSTERIEVDVANNAANMTALPDGSVTRIDDDVRATEESLPFIVDTAGDASLAARPGTTHKLPAKRASSPAPSDSSEEVVLFHGRNKRPTVISDPISAPVQERSQRSPGPRLEPAAFSTGSTDTPPVMGWGLQPSKFDTTVRSENQWSPAPSAPYWKKGKGAPQSDLKLSDKGVKSVEEPRRSSREPFSDQAFLETVKDAEETIMSLQADWKKTLREKKKSKQADLETDHASKVPSSSRRGKRGRKKDNRAVKNTPLSDENDSEAAYDDYMQNLKAQLDGETGDMDENEDILIAHPKATSQSAALAGPSMVVHGEAVDDHEVLPDHMKLSAEDFDDGQHSIQLDDSGDWSTEDDVLNPDPDEISSDSSLNASDLEDELEYTERQQWEDEDDLRQRRIDRMTDEQIARLLAKQEELGMAGDDILLEDGENLCASEDDFGDLSAARAGLSSMDNRFSTSRNTRRGTRRRGGDRKLNFPDASMLADTVDQYGVEGFDIMDFDRPSLRPAKRGKKGKLPPGLEMLSDEELKDEITRQWEKDRNTKRIKKLEREELRAEGFLGSAGRKGRANLHQKYPLGMTLKQVWEELRLFLQDDDLRERAFPPMDKTDRKALHEVAVAFNLNSKSQGGGLKRFPIIYKTSRTEEFSEDMFARVLSASSRGFLTNRSKAKKLARQGGKGVGGGGGKGRGGGGGLTAASIRHGEVVGTGAAEIGKDSFGHRLMERMGWTKGTGLGKDGEGLLVPVEQKMRVGTAGLG